MGSLRPFEAANFILGKKVKVVRDGQVNVAGCLISCCLGVGQAGGSAGLVMGSVHQERRNPTFASKRELERNCVLKSFGHRLKRRNETRAPIQRANRVG